MFAITGIIILGNISIKPHRSVKLSNISCSTITKNNSKNIIIIFPITWANITRLVSTFSQINTTNWLMYVFEKYVKLPIGFDLKLSSETRIIKEKTINNNKQSAKYAENKVKLAHKM